MGEYLGIVLVTFASVTFVLVGGKQLAQPRGETPRFSAKAFLWLWCACACFLSGAAFWLAPTFGKGLTQSIYLLTIVWLVSAVRVLRFGWRYLLVACCGGAVVQAGLVALCIPFAPGAPMSSLFQATAFTTIGVTFITIHTGISTLLRRTPKNHQPTRAE